MKKLRDKLCRFSGEDFSIIERCDTNIQIYFSLIGGFVLAILVCCFISSFLFMENIFKTPLIDLCIAGIWGLIVANLYLLTLYTITPRLLPINKIKFPEKNYYLSISFLYRISVLIILAIVTARPINIAFQTNIIGSAFIILIFIIIFLLPIIFKYYIRIIGGFYKEKATIEKKIIEDNYMVFNKDLKIILENNICDLNKKTWEKIVPFLTKLELVNKEKYHDLLSEIKVDLNYKDSFHEAIEKHEYWADPPYRTIPKKNLKFASSEADFLTHIYKN
jgi:hypothetical protein